MDSMEHGSNHSQIVDSDPNPDFDFDGKKLHVKSFPISCSDQEGDSARNPLVVGV